MKKYETFSEQALREICESSESYREVATKVGYAPDGGSGIKAIKELIERYEFDITHFKGQGHTKNIGKIHAQPFRTPIEDYLSNKVIITSHKLRLRLLAEGIFEKECSCCHNTQWLEHEIPLELHHKDGNKNNNTLDNLSLLCPNCHVFTDTYKTKNWS